MRIDSSKLPPLDEGIVHADPIRQFIEWYDVALKADLKRADAMSLATSTKDGRPSARTVLLKHVDQKGFVFYTNYNSRKGKELAENPVGALVFYWAELDRSVRVEGAIIKLSSEESDAYFSTRARESQLSALTSSQSEVVGNRAELDSRFQELSKQFEGKSIPRPPEWGGYSLQPERIEFWQTRFARLNDRILYERLPDGSWSRKRLAP